MSSALKKGRLNGFHQHKYRESLDCLYNDIDIANDLGIRIQVWGLIDMTVAMNHGNELGVNMANWDIPDPHGDYNGEIIELLFLLNIYIC